MESFPRFSVFDMFIIYITFQCFEDFLLEGGGGGGGVPQKMVMDFLFFDNIELYKRFLS